MKYSLLIFSTLFALLVCQNVLGVEAATKPAHNSIQIMTNDSFPCPVPRNTQNNDILIFGESSNHTQVWDHANDSDLFSTLRLNKSNYKLSVANTQTSACSYNNLHGVLLKKLGDWSQQHVNGVEFLAPHIQQQVAAIKTLTLTLKIDSAKSFSPTKLTLQHHFAQSVSEQPLAILANPHYFIGLTLFAQSSETSTSPQASFNADIIIELLPTQTDKWLTLNIPINAFTYYSELHYEATPLALNDFGSRLLKGLRVVAETQNGKVARNANPQFFADNPIVHEQFKEVSINIGRIVLN